MEQVFPALLQADLGLADPIQNSVVLQSQVTHNAGREVSDCCSQIIAAVVPSSSP